MSYLHSDEHVILVLVADNAVNLEDKLLRHLDFDFGLAQLDDMLLVVVVFRIGIIS